MVAQGWEPGLLVVRMGLYPVLLLLEFQGWSKGGSRSLVA